MLDDAFFPPLLDHLTYRSPAMHPDEMCEGLSVDKEIVRRADVLIKKDFLAAARGAGLAFEPNLKKLETLFDSYGPEKALLRLIADLLHDARPIGNDRSERAWKAASNVQATCRRLAELRAAPRVPRL